MTSACCSPSSSFPKASPIHIDCFVRAGGNPSAGTFHSLVHAMGRLRQSHAGRPASAASANPSRADAGSRARPAAPQHDDRAGAWVVPFPSIDPQTVLRSARVLDRYGPDFTYSHYIAIKRLPVLAGLAVGAGGLLTLAQIPPTRNALLKLMSSGDGPSPEQREKGWFKVRFAADAGGQHLITEVAGGDPGYGETSKMLGEAGLCLALDDLPQRAGQLTPAVAMGDTLIERLQRAGHQLPGHRAARSARLMALSAHRLHGSRRERVRPPRGLPRPARQGHPPHRHASPPRPRRRG